MKAATPVAAATARSQVKPFMPDSIDALDEHFLKAV
jgi:hypothetical protein